MPTSLTCQYEPEREERRMSITRMFEEGWKSERHEIEERHDHEAYCHVDTVLETNTSISPASADTITITNIIHSDGWEDVSVGVRVVLQHHRYRDRDGKERPTDYHQADYRNTRLKDCSEKGYSEQQQQDYPCILLNCDPYYDARFTNRVAGHPGTGEM
ncbi:hypothetical protein ACH3XW_9400 [Acanthocheilonema viteae]